MNVPGNKSMVMILAVLIAIQVRPVLAERVEERNDRTERFVVSSAEPVLEISNIWGDVHVLPGPDGEITLTIRERRSAPGQALFERSLEYYGLVLKADEAGVVVQVGDRSRHWPGSDPCRGCRVEYQFEARVPGNTRVDAETVNDGEVTVAGIGGPVIAGNVNGPVSVLDVRSCESLESVNGDVSIRFSQPPLGDCQIDTINGDITIGIPGDSGIDLAINLNNGRITSELPVDPVAIPARVAHRESGGNHKYTIEQAAGVRLAGGGPVFSVTSMNGDLRIQKTK